MSAAQIHTGHAGKSAVAAVVLQGVEKSYGAQPVLRDVSLTVDEGDFVALVGRSGSGKSTLLHIIGGLDRSYRGRAEVLGVTLSSGDRALDDRALSRFRNEKVGLVFQGFHLLEHLDCVENVLLPDYFAVADHPAPESRALEALSRVGIADHARKRPGALSGGQKQRVAIARALLRRPSLLLADEPTGNLDSETGAHILSLFTELHGDGLTLVVVTHEERVSRIAHRVVRLEDGRIVATPAPAFSVADSSPPPSASTTLEPPPSSELS